MKTLLLLRHAKSSWHDDSIDDHDRPLNDRGRRDAPRMGALIAEKGLVPDRILTSTAVRARTTAAAVADACGFQDDLIEVGEMYLAPPVTLLECAARQSASITTMLLVAHNPGMATLVSAIAGESAEMPTAALAQVRVDGEWADLAEAALTLVDVWRPKQL
jgi:phosphohistidine phosphatase